MRTFAHFPQDSVCPICGKNTDDECVLVPIVGTGDERIVEGQPTHVECLVDGVMYYRNHGAIAIDAPYRKEQWTN